jgi:RNA polymerase sigma-70 factor, ECF subfamily
MKQWIATLFQVSDEQAMWRVQMDDDPEAFAHLLSRWQEPIRRLCTRMLGDEHKAQDVTQEAFARIYMRRKEFKQGAKFSTFLWRVAVNLCIDEIRRIKRRREFNVLPDSDDEPERHWEEIPGEEPRPDVATEAVETAAIVRRAVLQLPEHYKTVVVLRHYENLKFREIADVLGIPEGTVKSRMAEALSILSTTLRSGKEQKAAWPSRTSIRKKENLVL